MQIVQNGPCSIQCCYYQFISLQGYNQSMRICQVSCTHSKMDVPIQIRHHTASTLISTTWLKRSQSRLRKTLTPKAFWQKREHTFWLVAWLRQAQLEDLEHQSQKPIVGCQFNYELEKTMPWESQLGVNETYGSPQRPISESCKCGLFLPALAWPALNRASASPLSVNPEITWNKHAMLAFIGQWPMAMTWPRGLISAWGLTVNESSHLGTPKSAHSLPCLNLFKVHWTC